MKREMKRKVLRAVLCGLAVMLACMMLPVTSYAYTQKDHPSTVLTPDGLGWTLYDPLPETDYMARPAPFWELGTDHDKLVTTGQALNLVADKAGVGEHAYKYERHGEVPVYAWQLKHEFAHCCQANFHSDYFHGLDVSDSAYQVVCGKSYWSGWFPVCADCGEYIAPFLHYAKTESIQKLDMYDVDMFYYYQCPHNGHLEQGIEEYIHECDALSANRYMVVYKPNCGEYDGEMFGSFHMYCNATRFEGDEVVLNKNIWFASIDKT